MARLGERKREIVTFSELTPEVLDATTAIEDKDFWVNPGFDLAGFVSATVDTINGRPAAAPRSPSSSFGLACCRRAPSRAAARSGRSGDHPVAPPAQAYPGEGKQQIITAYLNQNFYGNSQSSTA